MIFYKRNLKMNLLTKQKQTHWLYLLLWVIFYCVFVCVCHNISSKKSSEKWLNQFYIYQQGCWKGKKTTFITVHAFICVIYCHCLVAKWCPTLCNPMDWLLCPWDLRSFKTCITKTSIVYGYTNLQQSKTYLKQAQERLILNSR